MANEMYSIVVTKEEMDLIGKGLGKLPLEESVGLYAKLKVAITKQQVKVSMPAADAAQDSINPSVSAGADH